MGRRILAVIVGLFAGTLVNYGLMMVQHALYPMPPGFDRKDVAQVQAYTDTLPTAAWLLLLAAHAGGALVGAALATRIAKTARLVPALVVGVLFLLGGIANVMMIRHPTWFAIVDVLLYVPAALLGGKLAARSAEPVAVG
jgi:hypothetical protein